MNDAQSDGGLDAFIAEEGLPEDFRRTAELVCEPLAQRAHRRRIDRKRPAILGLCGAQGSGKTTTTGKLAAFYRGQDRTVLLCAADTFRAAAIEQLEVWATRSDVPMIKTKTGGDPSAALYDACTAAKARGK